MRKASSLLQRRLSLSGFLFSAVVWLGAASGLSGQVLREWNFDEGAGTLESLGWSGWAALGDARAVNLTHTLSAKSTEPRLGQIKAIKSPNGTTLLAASSGSGSAALDRFVAVVTFDELSLDEGLGKVVWTQAVTKSDAAVRLLVRVGDRWYASAKSFSNKALSTPMTVTNTQTHELDLAGRSGLNSTAWHEVSSGDSLPIRRNGKRVRAPLGRAITGLGFLYEFGGAHDRRVYIDDVQIVAAR